MIDDVRFSIKDEFGKRKNYIILEKFTKNNKNYMIYKEENDEDILACLYEIKNDAVKLIPIEDDKDFDIVDKYLEEI